MVLRADVLGPAIDHARAANPDAPAIYLSPRGKPLDQVLARELAAGPGVVLVAGRFEGIDERVIEARSLREISIGDYVLSGGDLAAMVLIDACIRLLPGVLGKSESTTQESFENGLLEHPHYTKPREWEGLSIPGVLLSGDHKKIAEWRHEQALKLTSERRPDLIARRERSS
jgi:tRNA (guanine37-N1)-methyltransferase